MLGTFPKGRLRPGGVVGLGSPEAGDDVLVRLAVALRQFHVAGNLHCGGKRRGHGHSGKACENAILPRV